MQLDHDVANLVEAVARVSRPTPAGLDDPAAGAKLVTELVEFDRSDTTMEALSELADIIHYCSKMLITGLLTPGAMERIVEPVLNDIYVTFGVDVRWSDLTGVYRAKYETRMQHGKSAERERVALAEWVVSKVRNLVDGGMTISDAASSFIADPELRTRVVRELEIEALAAELECDTLRAAEMYDILLTEHWQ